MQSFVASCESQSQNLQTVVSAFDLISRLFLTEMFYFGSHGRHQKKRMKKTKRQRVRYVLKFRRVSWCCNHNQKLFAKRRIVISLQVYCILIRCWICSKKEIDDQMQTTRQRWMEYPACGCTIVGQMSEKFLRSIAWVTRILSSWLFRSVMQLKWAQQWNWYVIWTTACSVVPISSILPHPAASCST
jgi:hypothetical protein